MSTEQQKWTDNCVCTFKDESKYLMAACNVKKRVPLRLLRTVSSDYLKNVKYKLLRECHCVLLLKRFAIQGSTAYSESDAD